MTLSYKFREWKLCKDNNFRFQKKKNRDIKRDGNWEEYLRIKNSRNNIIKTWPDYESYCKSKEFKKWKRKVLNKYNKKCIICGDKATIAHHINYRRWGTEKVEDGVAVCQYHHDYFHYDKEIEKLMKEQFD